MTRLHTYKTDIFPLDWYSRPLYRFVVRN